MQFMIPSCIAFALFYFIMRYLKVSWEQRKLPSWSRYPLGVFAWGTFLGFAGIVVGVVMMIIHIFMDPGFSSGFAMIAFALGVGAIAKFANGNPELFDYQAMIPFLKDSLAFVDPTRRWTNIFEELDKHEVRKVYKEIEGKELLEQDVLYDEKLKQMLGEAKPGAFSSDTRVKSPKEAEQLLAQPVASPHLKLELEQLREGQTVDVSDSWKINRLKRSSHDYFKLVEKVIVDPAEKSISIFLQSETFTLEQAKDLVTFFRMKQDVYDFLQAVHQREWVQPYLAGIETFICTCSHYEDEAFVGPRVHPVCSFEISRAELKAHEHSYFNAGEMKGEVVG